jgi:hypothetical protein
MQTPGSSPHSRRKRVVIAVALVASLPLIAGVVIPVFSRNRQSAVTAAAPIPAMGPVDVAAGRTAPARPAGEAGYESAPPPKWSASPMLIRTASLRLRVDDVLEAQAQVVRIARDANGYVAASTLSTEAGPTYAEITIRIPNAGMDSVMDRIASLGKLLSKQSSSQEVTEEFVDLTSRRRNLEREEVRLLELLERAGKVTDLLEVEQTLARVRGEIETIAGRLRYLENRVALSTVQVQLEGPQPGPTEGGPAWAPSDVARQAVRSLLNTGRILATVAIWVGVHTPIWLPILVLYVWFARRTAARKRKTAGDS